MIWKWSKKRNPPSDKHKQHELHLPQFCQRWCKQRCSKEEISPTDWEQGPFCCPNKNNSRRKEVKITQKQLLKSGKIRTVPAYLWDPLKGRFCGFSEIFRSVYNEGVHVLPIGETKDVEWLKLSIQGKTWSSKQDFSWSFISLYMYIFMCIIYIYICVYIYICRYIIHGFFQISFLFHPGLSASKVLTAPSMPWKSLG